MSLKELSFERIFNKKLNRGSNYERRGNIGTPFRPFKLFPNVSDNYLTGEGLGSNKFFSSLPKWKRELYAYKKKKRKEKQEENLARKFNTCQDIF